MIRSKAVQPKELGLKLSGGLLEKATEGVRALSQPACLKDSQLRYIFVNDAYSRLMRRPAEDMIGWGSYQLSGATDDIAREDKERRALVFATEEAIACHIDGHDKRLKLHCERFIDEDDALYLYEIFETASSDASAESQWLEREQRLLDAKAERDALIAEQESLLQALPFGVMLINSDKIIEYANQAFYELWDVSAKFELKGNSYRSYLQHNFDYGLSDYGDQSFEEVYADRVKIFDTDDEVADRTIHARNGKVLSVSKSRIAGHKVLLTLYDVTTAHQRELDLVSTLARAEAADRAKSEFLANMSHEIRTPMNGVLGMAELLAKSGLNARQKTFTEVIVKSANALLTIINDILDISKIDAGEMSLREVPFEPSEAVEDVASLLATQAQDKNIELLVDIKPGAKASILGDAGRFRQIVINLIGNAVKYTETGHVLVELSLRAHDAEKSELELKISDSGIGIAPAELAVIFGKFNQAGSSGIRRHEGTGLGLSITAGLVDLFGGKISAESMPNSGSCFTVALPVTVHKAASNAALRRSNGLRPSVLTIGGSEIGHRIMLEQLTHWGLDAHHAANGLTGLAILREAESIGFAIDTVIIDHQLPEVDGRKIADAIRADRRFDAIGIIMICATGMNGSEQFAPSGAVDILMTRPARGPILRQALSELILDKRPVANTALPSAQVATLSPIDILVVEDDDVNQIVFSQILLQNGLSFRIVSSGREAIETWHSQNPALILMDISMPQMSGYEATRLIRKAELAAGNNARVPIIGVTAHILETERELCEAAGMDDYLAKPVSPEILIAKISAWLNRQLILSESQHG
jgi:signal transduction histidine kinase/DNA-binding response OmpR family regulator